MNDIELSQEFHLILHRWWLIALLTIVGGLSGWVVGYFLPPVYEATAFYKVDLNEDEVVKRDSLPGIASLDYARTNLYLGPVADMFFDPEISTELVLSAAQNGISMTSEDFRAPTFSLDRRGMEWFITVRDRDPETAALLANLWLELVDARLNGQLAHASSAEDLQIVHALVETCFTGNNLEQGNQCAGTTFSGPSDLEAYLQDLEGQIASEQEDSGGLVPVISLEITRQAEPSSAPILYRRSLLMASGSLLGLLLSMLVISIQSRSHTSL
jgi:hypothetical protein